MLLVSSTFVGSWVVVTPGQSINLYIISTSLEIIVWSRCCTGKFKYKKDEGLQDKIMRKIKEA